MKPVTFVFSVNVAHQSGGAITTLVGSTRGCERVVGGEQDLGLLMRAAVEANGSGCRRGGAVKHGSRSTPSSTRVHEHLAADRALVSPALGARRKLREAPPGGKTRVAFRRSLSLADSGK